MIAVEHSVDVRLVERILDEYRQMPGLSLTMRQACRLWGCDAMSCRRVAEELIERHVLRWSHDGLLVRAE